MNQSGQRIRCGSRVACFLAAFCIAAGVKRLSAQAQAALAPDSLQATTQSFGYDLLEHLPADRIDALLPLRPGITATNLGQLSIRGGAPGDAAVYLDGVPVLSGFRGLPFFRRALFQTTESSLSTGTNAIERVDVTTGPLPASTGNGRAGSISYWTRTEHGPLQAKLSLESGEALGGASNIGSNRLEASLGGALVSGLSIFAAGVLDGQREMDTGVEAERAPLFVPASVDTSVSIPDLFDPAGVISVPVYRYAAAERAPGSGVSSYQFLAKATYALGMDGSLSLLAAASQQQNRNFDYGNLENPQALTGNRGSSAVYTLSLRQPLGSLSPITVEAHLSHQRDREVSGPLTVGAAADLDAPFGGFAVSPLEHRFNFENFPVNEELARNFRFNIQGSRRTPLDFNNLSQYFPVDRFRNNAYALYHRAAVVPLQFYEAGGPSGQLTLYRESRWVGAGALDWRMSDAQRVRVGGEFTRLTIGNYSHPLTDITDADVYVEHPVGAAIFVEDRLSVASATITAGLRLDHYRSGARHPLYPVIVTHPRFDPAAPDELVENDSIFPPDESHRRLSPHLHITVPVSGATVFRAGYAQQVQLPDLRLVFSGINSDQNISGFQQAFGSDLDFEKTTTYELGIRYSPDRGTVVDAAAYVKQNRDDVLLRLTTGLDPSTATQANFRQFQNAGRGDVRGLDLLVDRQLSSVLRGSVAYSYQDATTTIPGGFLVPETRIATEESRPHALSGILALQLPTDWHDGSLAGTVLGGLGVYTTFRVASGTAYTRCSGSGNELSGAGCFPSTADGFNSERLPTFKQLDLRLTKDIGIGRRTLTAFVDARNLLNTRNVLAVFASSGGTDHPGEASDHRARALNEYSGEAQASGALRPDGSIDLSFGGLPDPRSGCGSWQTEDGSPAVPNCVYLIRAEERFGNGDHVFDVAEQVRSANALYNVIRGIHNFTGAPRRVRLGLEFTF